MQMFKLIAQKIKLLIISAYLSGGPGTNSSGLFQSKWMASVSHAKCNLFCNKNKK